MLTIRKRRGSVPEIRWETLVGLLDLMDTLIHKFGSDVESVCCADLATFIWNEGDLEDQAEALLALYPIALSLHERLEEAKDAAKAEAEKRKVLNVRTIPNAAKKASLRK